MQQYNTASNKGSSSLALATMTFNGTTFQPIAKDGQIWITASDLSKALGYSRSDKVTQIYSRNSDEFTEAMTLNLNLRVKGFGNGNSQKLVRVFSLRGCHLIAMFANTKIAKNFRVWVLNILDREAGVAVPQPPAITDADWTRYARSMTIPEMVQLTGYNEREVVNALHKVMGSAITTTSPAPVLTPELQYALDRFWGFIATQDIATLNHSHKSHELAISIPEVYALSDQCQWQMPDTSLVYKALRLSNTPRFHRANTVIASVIGHKSRRVWIFVKSFNQTVIANK